MFPCIIEALDVQVDDGKYVKYLAIQYRSDDHLTEQAMRSMNALFDTLMPQMSALMKSQVQKYGYRTAVVEVKT